jgi:predicted RNA-binding Zn ribbon-like protein
MGDTVRAGTTGTSAIELLVDFVNTYEPQVDGEAWGTADDLGLWLAGRQLIPVDAVLRAADLATAITVREGLRAILAGHAGHHSDDESIQALDQVLAGVAVRVTLDDAGLRLSGPSGTAMNGALAQLLDAVRECTQSGAWPKLKVCARDSCRWAFYDASRNQVRRWCSMAGCGNHIKMKRAYTARKSRTGASSAGPS